MQSRNASKKTHKSKPWFNAECVKARRVYLKVMNMSKINRRVQSKSEL